MIQHAHGGGRDIEGLVVRRYRRADHAAVLTLCEAGRACGTHPYEPIEDLLEIETAYFTRPTDHLWVADLYGRVLGMVAAVGGDDRAAVIRRLCVDRDYRHTPVAALLIKAAIRHCWDHDALKVVLDAPIDVDEAATLLIDSGLRFSRTVTRGRREMFEFYIDLYHEPLVENGVVFDDHHPRLHFRHEHTQAARGATP